MCFVYAAAAYGLTREKQTCTFGYALLSAFSLWMLGYLMQGKLPRTGLWPWILTFLILGFGWFITGLGWLDDFMDGALPSWLPRFASSLIDYATYDTESSILAMLRTSALLGGMLMAIDFWQVPNRARGLVLVTILSSFGMVMLFFLQRIVGPPFILMSQDGSQPLAFATYRYHGNAAAYLNLCWPISAAVAIFAAIRQSKGWPFWFLPLAVTLIATFLNVSKAGNVLAPVGILILLLTLIPYFSREIKRSKRRIRKSRILVALVPIVILAASVPFALPWKRWESIDIAKKGRATAYAELVKMVPDAGFTGFGPGTFSTYSLVYTNKNPSLRHLWYNMAHQDYLQTIIEWGYVGTVLWALLLFPPVIFLFKAARRNFSRRSHEFEGYRINISDHVAAFFETIPTARDGCLGAGAFTAVILTTIHSTFDFPMQIASLQFYFLILLALGWSYRLPDLPTEEASG
jgi:O-antigen ligase